MGVIPEEANKAWDECNVWTQALLISYNQIRELEDDERLAAMMGAKLT